MKTVCPICEQSKEEQTRLKEMLAAEEGNNPHLFGSIVSAISPLLHLSAQSDLIVESTNSGQASQSKASAWKQHEK